MGAIVRGFAPSGHVTDLIDKKINTALEKYAELIEPWAHTVAEYMLADVARRNYKMWQAVSKEIGAGVRQELKTAPTGFIYHEMMAEQVSLITSLPLSAGQRVHELVAAGLVDGRRAAEIAKEILRTEDVTESRARLIARTEVARAASKFTQARAEYAGSDGYIWRTSGDSDVRKSHQEMEGKYVRWNSPPHLSDGTVTHAGGIYNCRCFSEPIFPDI